MIAISYFSEGEAYISTLTFLSVHELGKKENRSSGRIFLFVFYASDNHGNGHD